MSFTFETFIFDFVDTESVDQTMVLCPRCGNEALDSSTEWEFADFHVKLFVCSKCKKTFKAYYQKGRLSHTIPKHSGQTFHSGSAHAR